MARPIKCSSGSARNRTVSVRLTDLDYGRLWTIQSKLPGSRQVGASQADAISFALRIADMHLVRNPQDAVQPAGEATTPRAPVVD